MSFTLSKYIWAVRRFSDWEKYFLGKVRETSLPLELTLRKSGIRVLVPDDFLMVIFKEIFLQDFYQMSLLTETLPERPTVVDIGANVGYFDLCLLDYRPEGRVFSYEPIPANVEVIQRQIDLNPNLSSRITVNQMAVTGSEQGPIELFLEEGGTGNSVTASIFSDFESHNRAKIEVPSTYLSQILTSNQIETIDLLKLDCEGAEYPILYEAEAEILQRVRQIAMEVHQFDEDRRNCQALERYLTSHGFNCKSDVTFNGCYYLQALRD